MPTEKIKFSQLKQWVDNYTQSAYKEETRNVVFKIEDLKKLLAYCETHPESKDINAIRFYLVRQDEFGRHEVLGKQSQISLVATAVKNFKDNEFDANDQLIPHDGGFDVKENDNILVAYPLDDNHEHSGLCPYNCQGSIHDIEKFIS